MHHLSPSRRLPRLHVGCAAFTLVELLVIIAIIAILLSLMAPTLRMAIGQSDKLNCTNNMRQFANACCSYAAENRSHLPGPNWRRAGAHGWLYFDLKMDLQEHLAGGQLWKYTGDAKLYRCPADTTVPALVPNRPNNSRAITSYCMNGSVCGYGGRTYDSSTGQWDTYRVTDFEDPDTDVIMWEADEEKAGGWWWDGSNYPWEGITRRHLDYGNVVTVAGSAEPMLLDEYYSMDVSGERTRLWNVPGKPTGR